MRRASIAAAASLLCAGTAFAQSGPPVLATVPATPRAGTLFRVTFAPKHPVDTSARVIGRAGDEPLHFVRDSTGRFTALAAMPIDARRLRVETGIVRAAADTMGRAELDVRASAGAYPSERLRVDPRFGAKPDSALLARTARESRRAAEVARAAHDTPQLWKGAFAAPRPGRVTSGYGRARVFNGTVASRHMGTDFAGATGAPVKAANRGVVRIVDQFYYGGNVVYVDHGAGLVTAYLHLSEQAVAVGDTVAKGQVLGRVGATGRVTGPHLHLIARYGNVTVDPLSLPGLR
jgi:murein DD-endopeptidase MepM/ murein hydrolase activator NlpD